VRDVVGGLEYVRGHLEEALATDARVNEPGLKVLVEGNILVVRGVVSTGTRAAAVEAVARDVVPQFRVRNATTVVRLDEPAADEDEDVE
jgi:hypothetical protein